MDEVVGPDGVRRVRLDVTRLAPGRAGVAGSRPEAREPDVELDERAAGVERTELLDAILSPWPGSERGACSPPPVRSAMLAIPGVRSRCW